MLVVERRYCPRVCPQSVLEFQHHRLATLPIIGVIAGASE